MPHAFGLCLSVRQFAGLFVSAQLLWPIVCSLVNCAMFLNEVELKFSWRC